AQSRRPVEQHMIQRLATAPRRLDRDRNILFDALLADVFVQPLRTDAGFNPRVLIEWGARHNALRLSWGHHPLCARVGHSLFSASFSQRSSATSASLHCL